jgi:transcriptional regulator with XRE-family HTH domain
MAILSPVEKLITLRKKYKINQKDLAGDQISRSHLAMIETGKNKLNENTAKILVENFNRIFKERKIYEIITFEELMESKEKQIEKLKLHFLQELEKNENVEHIISDVESYASEYDIQTKITLYEKIGNLFFEKENLHRAASFYLRILNDLIIISDLQTLGKISLSLIRIYLKTENFNAAVDLENLIKSEIDNFQHNEKTIILYNLGVIHDNLKNHQKSLYYFKSVESYIFSSEKIFEVKNYQALALADLKKYDDAISIYRSLMLKYTEINYKIIINDNLLYISRLQNNLDKIKFYLRKGKKLIISVNPNDISGYALEQTLFEIGETSLILNKNKDAIHYFFELCNEKTKQNLNLKFSAIGYLLNLLTKKDLKIVQKIEKFYFDLLKREKKLEISFYFIDFYMKNGLQKEVSNLLHNIKPFSKF